MGTKEYIIEKVPDILFIIPKRFETFGTDDTFQWKKIDTEITTNTKIKMGNAEFKLRSLGIHEDWKNDTGHYYANIFIVDGNYLKCNDRTIKHITSENYLNDNKQAYLFGFEIIDDKPLENVSKSEEIVHEGKN